MSLNIGKRIAFLGGGAMGEALLRGILKAGLVLPGDVMVSEISEARRNYLAENLGVQAVASNAEAAEFGEILLMVVKPNVVSAVLADIADLSTEKMLISIAAGVTTFKIESQLNNAVPVIRVMPNTPALVGEGASALCRGSNAGVEHLEAAKQLFSAVGVAVEVPESMMDAVTGLSGSGPAYAFLAIEALADGGVRAGLPRAISQQLAAQTLLGAAKMVRDTGKHPGELKDMVTSPGGTTIAGIAELEQAAVRSAFIEAVAAATLRSKELGKG
jgi:pyrroline-5-carboxylate reductase